MLCVAISLLFVGGNLLSLDVSKETSQPALTVQRQNSNKGNIQKMCEICSKLAIKTRINITANYKYGFGITKVYIKIPSAKNSINVNPKQCFIYSFLNNFVRRKHFFTVCVVFVV